VDQHVNVKVLLQLHHLPNFLLNSFLVFLFGNLFGLVFTADAAELNGLREGSDGGGGEDRKVEILLLSVESLTNIGFTAVI